MGVRVEFAFEHEEFTAALTRMTLTPARKTGLLRAIGVGLQHTTRDRFQTGTDPAGQRWRALNPAYAAGRRYPDLPILQQAGDRGGLRGSISFRTDAAASTVTVGSNKVYAAVHQFGAVITPKAAPALVFRLGGRLVHAKRVTIPARPYLGFGREDELVVLDAVDVLLPGGR